MCLRDGLGCRLCINLRSPLTRVTVCEDREPTGDVRRGNKRRIDADPVIIRILALRLTAAPMSDRRHLPGTVRHQHNRGSLKPSPFANELLGRHVVAGSSIANNGKSTPAANATRRQTPDETNTTIATLACPQQLRPLMPVPGCGGPQPPEANRQHHLRPTTREVPICPPTRDQ